MCALYIMVNKSYITVCHSNDKSCSSFYIWCLCVILTWWTFMKFHEYLSKSKWLIVTHCVWTSRLGRLIIKDVLHRYQRLSILRLLRLYYSFDFHQELHAINNEMYLDHCFLAPRGYLCSTSLKALYRYNLFQLILDNSVK